MQPALQTSCSRLYPVSVLHALLHASLHALLGLEGAASPVLRLLLSLQAKSKISEFLSMAWYSHIRNMGSYTLEGCRTASLHRVCNDKCDSVRAACHMP